MTADDIEAWDRIGKSKGNSKKTIIRFINRKHCKCVLVNRKKLKSFNSESIGLPNVKLYFNESLTECNNALAFYGRNLNVQDWLIVLPLLMALWTFYELMVKDLSRSFIWVNYWNDIPILNFTTMMVMFQLMLLVMPQFSQAIEVLC